MYGDGCSNAAEDEDDAGADVDADDEVADEVSCSVAEPGCWMEPV